MNDPITPHSDQFSNLYMCSKYLLFDSMPFTLKGKPIQVYILTNSIVLHAPQIHATYFECFDKKRRQKQREIAICKVMAPI